MIDYYDRQGNPVTFMDWAKNLGDRDECVAKTPISDGEVLVSTVFLGINNNFFGGPPLIFETMIFGGPLDQFQERYTTEAQALEGHERAVHRARMAGSA